MAPFADNGIKGNNGNNGNVSTEKPVNTTSRGEKGSGERSRKVKYFGLKNGIR